MRADSQRRPPPAGVEWSTVAAAFGHHRFEVAVADRVPTVPTHRSQYDLTVEGAPFKILHPSLQPAQTLHRLSRTLQQSGRCLNAPRGCRFKLAMGAATPGRCGGKRPLCRESEPLAGIDGRAFQRSGLSVPSVAPHDGKIHPGQVGRERCVAICGKRYAEPHYVFSSRCTPRAQVRPSATRQCPSDRENP